MSDIDARLSQVRQSYINGLPAQIKRLNELWHEIKAGQLTEDSSPQQEEFYTLVHSLGGSGAMFDLPKLSETARPLELLFLQIKSAHSPDIQHIKQVHTLVKVLGEIVESITRQPGKLTPLHFSISEEKRPDTSSRLIYILDDDLSSAKVLLDKIDATNFDVKIYSDKNELQNALARNCPLALIVEEEYLLGKDDNRITSNLEDYSCTSVICLSETDDISTRVNALRGGANFFLTKPVETQRLTNTLDSLIEQGHKPAYRVLVIDDDPILADLYAAFLEHHNITVQVITDPQASIDTIRSFKPELVLLDIHMRPINGFEIARLVRQIPEFDMIAIIFMSSEQDVQQQLIAINNVGDFLKKPVWPEYLVATVLSKCRHTRKLIQTQNKLHNTLREHESQRLAMDQHSIISITDAQGTITYANKMFCDINGRSEAELIGENHRIVKSDEHSEEFFSDLWQTIGRGEIWHGEIKNKTKDGGYYWVESTIVPFLDEQGTPYQYISIRTDITRSKTAELEQKQSRQRLREQNTSLAILSNKEKLFLEDKSTAYGKIAELVAETLHINRASIWFFNKNRDALIREYLHDSMNADSQSDCYLETNKFPNFLQALSKERIIVASYALTNHFTKELNDKYLVKNNIESIMFAGIYHEGKCIGTICCESINNIREWWPEDKNYITTIADYISLLIEQWGRMAAQDELVIAKERAEKASKAKSEFLSRMSHELRTPLNAIIGFSQLMDINPDRLSAVQKDNIREILNAGRHLLSLINEMLDLSAIEAGKIQISIEPVNMHQVISESIQLILPLTRQKSVQVINNTANEPVEYMLVDYNRIKQVLINLLSNAIKYNTNQGKIYVSSDTSPEFVSIIIEDTGYGIPQDQMKNLFQPFERAAPAYEHIEGTGIGLVICKNLIELMNGHIYCASTVGAGSKFRIELPRYPNRNTEHNPQ